MKDKGWGWKGRKRKTGELGGGGTLTRLCDQLDKGVSEGKKSNGIPRFLARVTKLMRRTLHQDKKHRRKSRFGRKDDEIVFGHVGFKVLISHLRGSV